jgi:hypothetical protein
MDESIVACRNKTLITRIFSYRLVCEYLLKTYIDPAIDPPIPVSAARCTPDNTGGSNRRVS